MGRVLNLICVFALWVCSAAALELDGPRVDLRPHMVFAHGTGATPAQMMELWLQGGFSPDAAPRRYEGAHAPELWGAVELSGAPGRRQVVVEIPLVSEVDVYAIGLGGAVHLLDYSLFEPFRAEQHAGARLVSDPVEMAGVMWLFLHLKLGPVQQVAASLETPEAVAQRAVRDVAVWAAFYAFALAAIAVFLAYFAALRERMSLAYALLFLTGLGFLAYLDGLLFRFVYPGAPGVQSALGFGLFLALAGVGYGLAALGFRQGARRRAMQVCWALAGLSGAVFVFALLVPGPVAATLANLLVMGMCVAVGLGTRPPQGARPRSVALARGLSLAVLAGLLAVLVPLVVPGMVAPFGLLDAARAIYVILILGGLANLTAQILAVRQAQDAAQRAEMAALAREAALSRELAGSERNYARAQALAAGRQRQLATAAHDIRQPLQSLRLRLDSLRADLPGEAAARLREALDYIETLTSGYMEEAPEAAEAETAAEAEYDLSVLLGSVHRMFAPEAVDKGLELRLVPSSARTDLPAAPLMRILSNLVVNAVKHTGAGGVVLGVRRRGGRAYLCVADTGPGMTPEEFAAFRAMGVKGAASDGQGFGLPVCVALAEELGLELSMRSVPGQGTAFWLGPV